VMVLRVAIEQCGSGSSLDGSADLPVLALEEEERLALVHHNVLDLGDKNRVVACILRSVQTTLQVGQSATQDRGAKSSALESGAGFFGRAIVRARGPSVILGNRPLILRQDICAETFLRMKVRVGARALVHAHQHEHGIKLHRGKGIGGHAVHFVFRVERDHRNAGGETG